MTTSSVFSTASFWYTVSVLTPVVGAVLINNILLRLIHLPRNLESPRTRTYFSVAKSAIRTIVYITAAYFVFQKLHIDLTPLFASAGVVGIIIGLGVRSFIEDFFTGVLIFTQDTISVGDYVEIGDSEGITEALGLRTVRIRDQNGAVHIYPNREIKKIVNYSRRQARVVVDVPVESDKSIDTILSTFEKALTALRKDKELARYVQEGSMIQGIETITDKTVTIRTLILTRASMRWVIARQYNYLILKELEKAQVRTVAK